MLFRSIDLRARRKEAEVDFARLSAEMGALDSQLATISSEVETLEGELAIYQEAYNQAARSLYKRGEITKLEIILEAGELEQLWEDTAFYDHIMSSEVQTQENLRTKLGELELKRRDLRETMARRERLAETLDVGAMDARLAQLETRLSEINAKIGRAHV